MWQRTFPFKALIAIFWDLQPLWPSALTKPDLLRFRCSSAHVLSKTKSATPHFFTFLKSLTYHLSMVKFSEKINVRKFSRERFRTFAPFATALVRTLFMTHARAASFSSARTISFQKPTCLLVSTKTRSSGIINFQRPRF